MAWTQGVSSLKIKFV